MFYTFERVTLIMLFAVFVSVAGLYSALIFGVNVALQKSAVLQDNATKILTNLLHQQGNISDAQRVKLINALEQLPTSIEQTNANHALLVQLNTSISKVLSYYYNNSK